MNAYNVHVHIIIEPDSYIHVHVHVPFENNYGFILYWTCGCGRLVRKYHTYTHVHVSYWCGHNYTCIYMYMYNTFKHVGKVPFLPSVVFYAFLLYMHVHWFPVSFPFLRLPYCHTHKSVAPLHTFPLSQHHWHTSPPPPPPPRWHQSPAHQSTPHPVSSTPPPHSHTLLQNRFF